MRLAHIAILLLSFTGIAAGQSEDTTATLKEVGLSADRFVGISGSGEPIRRLIGNVRLVQDNTTLRSALATQWVDTDRILFQGNVLVVDEGDTLRADSVMYYRRTKTGNATGDVVLNDDEVRVLSTSAIYDVDDKHSVFNRGVTLIDSTSTLTGGSGEYFSDEKRARFFEDVVFQDSTTTIRSDTVVYLREEESAQAFGDVLITVIEDSPDSTMLPDIVRIAGPNAFSDRQENSNKIEGRSVAMRIEADSSGAYSDTLLVNADTLYALQADSVDLLTGTGNIMMWAGDVAALADSMLITSSDSLADEVVLTGSPIVWMDDSQLTADTIKVYVVDGEVDSVYAAGTVFLAQPDSASGETQQVTGQTLYGALGNGGEDRFTVGPNAEAIHFVSEDGELQGAVRASADRIVFYIKDEQPARISIISGVEGLYYQADDIPAGLGLTGFLWEPDRRPGKEDLMAEWPSYFNQPESETEE